MKKTTLFAGAIASATFSLGIVAALAHGGATGVVKKRMDSMKAMANAVKTVAAMVKGDTAYDADVVKAAAQSIRSHSGDALTRLFPEASTHEPSEALPKIWTDWDAFKDLAGRLEILSDGLSRAADNAPGRAASGSNAMMGSNGMMSAGGQMTGMGTMTSGGGMMPTPEMLASMPAQGVFAMIAKTCSSCHAQFRLEKN